MNYYKTLIKKAVLQILFASILLQSALSGDELLGGKLKIATPPPPPEPIDSPSPSAEAGAAASSAKDKFPDMGKYIFECRVANFEPSDYSAAVAGLFTSFEKTAGKNIRRGAKGKVGLKIYTNSGAGIHTPKALIEAVIAELGRRGYKREEVWLVDLSRRKLRDCGFLPKLSEKQAGAPDDYQGSPVADLESGKYFDKRWFYDSPLQPRLYRNTMAPEVIYDPELRKSMLPVPLFFTFDFWINLPVITELPGLGVSGAIGNISIWNVSNQERFLNSPANAPMAAAEMCAVPEMRDGYLFTIMTFEQVQYAGGAIFNSRATGSEHFIMLSSDIAALDYVAWETVNKYRSAAGFPQINPVPPVLDYCSQLKLGSPDIFEHKRIFVTY